MPPAPSSRMTANRPGTATTGRAASTNSWHPTARFAADGETWGTSLYASAVGPPGTERPGSNSGRGNDTSEIRHGAKIGRFVVEGQLGAGAMGVVYAAHDRELDRRVALKV